MKKRLLVLFIAGVLLFGVSSFANAAVLFYDNFDTENGGIGILNYNSFSNWSVSSGTVDLIGNGFFELQPGNGLYVDLDGSTSNAGMLISNEIWIPDAGNYTLSFLLAGNQRGAGNETVAVQVIFGGVSNVFTVAQNQNFTAYSAMFNVDAPGLIPIQLLFSNAGGDNMGALLDEVKVASSVPEPGTLMLLGSGLVGLAFAARRRRN